MAVNKVYDLLHVNGAGASFTIFKTVKICTIRYLIDVESYTPDFDVQYFLNHDQISVGSFNVYAIKDIRVSFLTTPNMDVIIGLSLKV